MAQYMESEESVKASANMMVRNLMIYSARNDFNVMGFKFFLHM